MAGRPFNESFDTSGEWYLPDNPDRMVAGSLRYTPERTELHLLEAFQPLRGAIHAGDSRQTYPVIHGITRDGEAMTLLNAQRIGISINSGSGGLRQPERILASSLLVGAHLPADFAYPEMCCRVPGLQIWLSRPIIEPSHERNETTGSYAVSYRIQSLDKETTRIAAIDADLDWGVSFNSNIDAFTTVAVTVSGWVTIRPDSPQAIAWYFEQQGKITAMLTFLAGSPMSPDCIQASIGGPHHEVSVMVALRDAKYCSYINLHDFYMPRGAMEAELADVVASWFEVYSKVGMPSQLTLSVFASEKLWLHVEFLSLMQALEGFHRGLHYGSRIDLDKRLDALAERLSGPLRSMILGGNCKVPRQWLDTRNYYTHWNEDLRSKALEGEGMYYANLRMSHFLRALYLDLMGIPHKAILKALGNVSDTSQHLVQLNALERRRTDIGDTPPL